MIERNHHLAQINIARFRRPMNDPVNADFVAALQTVNAAADISAGFVWRLAGEGGNATDIRGFDDPNTIVNLSVWTDIDALAAYVYRQPLHLDVMRRRKEWFERLEFFMALWWVPAGHRPTVPEGVARLECLKQRGPGPDAFTFVRPFAAPGQAQVIPILDRCA